MANTYTSIYIHLVFAVKFRRAQIPLNRRDDIYKYMAGVINKHSKCQAIKIGGISDHVHILCKISTKIEIADLVKAVKVATALYINDNGIVEYHNFVWQEGYAAFSISPTHTDALVSYIENQVDHHMGVGFLEEYTSLLSKNRVEFDEQYIFSNLL